MAGWTNKGKYRVLWHTLRAGALPTNFYLALVTSAIAPDADTNTLSDLTEIAAGNGYTSGGYALTPGTTDFDVGSEDDVNDRGRVQIKDVTWTASGGPIPASGDGARYAVLLDDSSPVSLRSVLFYWDLASDRSVLDGQTLVLLNCEARIGET